MLVATAVLLAATAGAGSDWADTRPRPPNACRVVESIAHATERRGADEEHASLRRSQARAWAALRESYGERWATLSPKARRHFRDEIRTEPFFSASSTLDLGLAVAVRPDLSPDARLELRLLTPRGHLYQSLAVAPPAPADPEAAGTTGKAERGRARREARTLSTAFPVAGTAIVNHSLYGRWTVEPYLDGQSCGPPVRFWIGE
jgi:hypothetical protein